MEKHLTVTKKLKLKINYLTLFYFNISIAKMHLIVEILVEKLLKN